MRPYRSSSWPLRKENFIIIIVFVIFILSLWLLLLLWVIMWRDRKTAYADAVSESVGESEKDSARDRSTRAIMHLFC